MESPTSLSIKTHSFSKRLGYNHFETLIQEISESSTICLKISRYKTLISGIKKGIKLFFFAYSGNFLPLTEIWVNTSGIVSTSMQEYYRARSCIPQISDHAIEVKSSGLFVKISILSYLESHGFENFDVIPPSRIADIDWSRSEFMDEFRNDPQGSIS